MSVSVPIEMPSVAVVPEKKPESDVYRWYACEKKWNGSAECEQLKSVHDGRIETQLVPVCKWTPKFLDSFVLASKLKPRVVIKKN